MIKLFHVLNFRKNTYFFNQNKRTIKADRKISMKFGSLFENCNFKKKQLKRRFFFPTQKIGYTLMINNNMNNNRNSEFISSS